jgi:hypothetical protein
MAWAKTRAAARFNLAGSAVAAVTPAEFALPTDGGDYTGPSFYGWPPLQEALARFLGAPASRIVHTVGTSMANHLAFAVLADPGDAVLVEDPTYELVPETARFLGLETLRFRRDPLHGGMPDPDELASRFTPRTRVVVLANLHNPTGARLDAETLRGVARLAEARGAWLLVDEVYLDATFGTPAPSAWNLGPNVVVTGSLTKVHGLAGLRCGWIVAPEAVAAAAWRLTDLFNVIPSHTAERQAVAALGRIDKLLARSRRILAANHAAFGGFIASRPELEWNPTGEGTVAFPRLRGGSVDSLAQVLRDRHETSIVPGRYFGRPDHFRIGLGGRPENFSEGLARLAAALESGEGVGPGYL